MFTVYALYSPGFNKIYIGYTSDLASRLESHNKFARKGYTIHFRPWQLIYSEEFATKFEAMQREKQLKSARGRRFIWHLIGKQ
jgi:putative endonuclease